jgi:carboxymethylenebutenolidase
MMKTLNPAQQSMLDLFQKHVKAELAGDLQTTMDTMTDQPHLTNVPLITGGVGRKGVRDFYANHLVGKFFPSDVEMIPVSQTIGNDQIVDELVIRFTHTQVIEWMLPGIAPTGKKVEMAVAVIVKVEKGKIAHEHIYWDQASVLAQLGLIDPKGLPVAGADGARKILNPALPCRVI